MSPPIFLVSVNLQCRKEGSTRSIKNVGVVRDNIVFIRSVFRGGTTNFTKEFGCMTNTTFLPKKQRKTVSCVRNVKPENASHAN